MNYNKSRYEVIVFNPKNRQPVSSSVISFAVASYLLTGLYIMQLNLFASKRCSHCKQIKLICHFHKDKSTKDGYCNQCKECRKIYYQEHREEINKKAKQYYQAHKEKRVEHDKQYQKTHKKEIAKQKKQYNKQYNQTPKGKLNIAKHNNKRKGLGFNPLNKSFKGSVWHHINDIDVVAIPKEIHLSCYAGHDTEEHRRLVLACYGTLENMLINYTPDGVIYQIYSCLA